MELQLKLSNPYSIITIISLIEFVLLTSKTLYYLCSMGDLPKESTFKCFRRNLIKGLILCIVPILNFIYMMLYFIFLFLADSDRSTHFYMKYEKSEE